MVDLIVFPDVESLLITEINAAMTALGRTTRASTRAPSPRPTEFVRIERFGGPKETFVSELAQIIIEFWASDEVTAAYGLSLVRAVLNSQDGDIFGVTEISGPSNLPDPTTSQVRFTQNFGVRVRGTILAQ